MNSSLLHNSIDNTSPSYNSTVIIMPKETFNSNSNNNFLDKYICNKNGYILITITIIIIIIIIIVVS